MAGFEKAAAALSNAVDGLRKVMLKTQEQQATALAAVQFGAGAAAPFGADLARAGAGAAFGRAGADALERTVAGPAANAVSGFLSNQTPQIQGSVGRSLTQGLAALPLIAELSGARRTENVARATEQRVGDVLIDAARYGGKIDDGTRDRLVSLFAEQEKRAEDERTNIRNAVNANVGEIAEGTPLGKVIEVLETIKGLIESFGGGAGG